MLVAFLLPLGLAIWTSFHGADGWTTEAYRLLAKNSLFWRVIDNTFQIAFFSSIAAILLGYPLALHMSARSERTRRFLTMLVLIPFWTSILVKSYAFIVIFGRDGLLNQALRASFFPFGPVEVLFTRTGVAIAMAHQIIPFVVLPLLSNLLSIDQNLLRAAKLMGASPFEVFWRVTLPLTLPGIAAAFMISFTLGLGAYITPALLGGRSDLMIANLIDLRLRETLDWPGASAIAITLTVIAGLLIVGSRLLRRYKSEI
ncbi:ABC transporter permease [Paraburkholderia sp.]|uniref:ABC transporter permease n=1 Tax=Paraburkholderia sp. TaxID=1926495 RepID=UPI0039E5AFF7